MAELPTVSALVAAYNYERYVGRAIESALAQDYPPELLEIVVIDDGSTDATASVVKDLARQHDGRRISLVRQANAGLTAAVNRAIAEARGEILAILDADDVWLPSKTRRNVELLRARPSVGLVFSDMAVVGADDQLLHQSLFAWAWSGWRPPRGEAFARLLAENFVTASSIAVRASLATEFAPIPDEIPYPDWWLATSVARVAELDYDDAALALYRLHGANLTGGATGAGALRERRKDLAFQLWCLRHLPLESLSTEQAVAVWAGIEQKARLALAAVESPFVSLTDRGAGARGQAGAIVTQAERAGGLDDPQAEARVMLQALATDPYCLDYRARLSDADRRARELAALPDPLAGSRRFVALVDAEELLSDDGLLTAFAAEFGDSSDVTLAIDASRLEAEQAVGELRSLVERCGLVGREDIHLVAVVGALHAIQRERMLATVRALYARTELAGSTLPSFTPASLPVLHELAAAATGA
jgi:hypothetical protein